MTCESCAEKRSRALELFLQHKFLAAAGVVVEGLAEMTGIKEKPDGGTIHSQSERKDQDL